jgi:hypothetical protein
MISDALSGDPRKVPTTTIIEGICKARGADAPTLERLLDMRAEANRQKPPDPPPLDRAPGEADDPVVSGSPDGRGEVGVTDPPGGNSQQHPERWWPPRPAVLVVVVLSLVLATAVAWGINTLVNACGGPGSGVSRVDGECVGVTDGSYVFDPALADVEAKIAAENARVAGSGHTVTVALLNLMTVNNTSPVSLAEVVNQLEGAYTAQYRANQTNDLGDPSPLIRLVLANEGSHENQWQPVVHQIEGMVGDQDPLVAVTGLGVSVKQTEDGAKDLAAHHIPMVGALTTADELNYKNIPRFHPGRAKRRRVCPKPVSLPTTSSGPTSSRSTTSRFRLGDTRIRHQLRRQRGPVHQVATEQLTQRYEKSDQIHPRAGLHRHIRTIPRKPRPVQCYDWQHLCSKRSETARHTVRWPRARSAHISAITGSSDLFG